MEVKYPSPSFDEHLTIEKKDGSWWMTARTGVGIWQSYSTDKGFTWTEPEKYQEHVNSRHFILRLKSGNLLLVRHGSLMSNLSLVLIFVLLFLQMMAKPGR